MSGLDALPLALAPSVQPSLAGAVVVAVSGETAALEALLAEKLLDAVVVGSPQRGFVTVATPAGPMTLALAQALPEGAALVLRPGTQPGRAIVTLRSALAAGPAAGLARTAASTLAVDLQPRVQGRILSERPGAPLRAGTMVELRIETVTPPADETISEEEPAGRADGTRATAPSPSPMAGGRLGAAPDADAADDATRPPPAPDKDEAEPPGAGAAPASRARSAPVALEPAAAEDDPRAGRASGRAPPGRLAGTVVASRPGETIAETEIGRLAIPAELGARPGSTIVFALLREIAGRAAVPLRHDRPPLPKELAGSIEQALASARAASPDAAGAVAAALQPSGPERILAAILSFAAAANDETLDPFSALARKLEESGRPLPELDRAGEQLGRFAASDPEAPLQPVMVPMMEGPLVQPFTLFVPRDGGGGAERNEQSTRFAIDLDMTRLGPLQLDGLVRGRRVDLVLRSRRPLPAELRAELVAAYRDSVAASGFTGEISFAVSGWAERLARRGALSVRV